MLRWLQFPARHRRPHCPDAYSDASVTSSDQRQCRRRVCFPGRHAIRLARSSIDCLCRKPFLLQDPAVVLIPSLLEASLFSTGISLRRAVVAQVPSNLEIGDEPRRQADEGRDNGNDLSASTYPPGLTSISGLGRPHAHRWRRWLPPRRPARFRPSVPPPSTSTLRPMSSSLYVSPQASQAPGSVRRLFRAYQRCSDLDGATPLPAVAPRTQWVDGRAQAVPVSPGLLPPCHPVNAASTTPYAGWRLTGVLLRGSGPRHASCSQRRHDDGEDGVPSPIVEGCIGGILPHREPPCCRDPARSSGRATGPGG